MHVGFDAKRYFFNTTGLGNYARSTINGLAAHFPQHRYTLYTPSRCGQLCTPAEQNGLNVQEPCPPGRHFPALWRSFGIPPQARQDKIDLFHGLSHELPLKRFAPGIRTVVTMHDLLFLTHPHLFPWIDRNVYAIKYRASCRRADMVIAISRNTAQDVQDLFGIHPDRVRVVYQSCADRFRQQVSTADLAGLSAKYSLPRPYILFVGSLVLRKMPQTLIQALAAVPVPDRPGLVLAGSGPLTPRLRTLIHELKLEDHVRLTGRVPDADLPGLYQGALAFAYPSQGEGFGIPILEALTSRVPVITSRGSCFAEAGGDAAIYVTPGNVEELAQAFIRVGTDAAVRQTMIERGSRHAQNFHPSIVAAEMIKVYSELHEI